MIIHDLNCEQTNKYYLDGSNITHDLLHGYDQPNDAIASHGGTTQAQAQEPVEEVSPDTPQINLDRIMQAMTSQVC